MCAAEAHISSLIFSRGATPESGAKATVFQTLARFPGVLELREVSGLRRDKCGALLFLLKNQFPIPRTDLDFVAGLEWTRSRPLARPSVVSH